MLNAWMEKRRAKRVSLLGGQEWMDAMGQLEETARSKMGMILLITDSHDVGLSDLDFYMMQRFKRMR